MDNLQPTYTHHYSTDFFNSPEEQLDYLITPKPINVRDTITPYFYVIRSKSLGAYYVGIKYSRKDANPSKFWSEYQTSSTTIEECINLYAADDFDIINVFDTDPHGNDWEFQTPENDDLKIGQFETDSIRLLELNNIRTLNKVSNFGEKNFNAYAIMPDGRTAGQWRAERSAKTKKTTYLDNGLTIAQAGAERAAITATTTILPNGKTIAQTGGERGAITRATKILDNGLTVSQDNAQRGLITRFNTVCDNGLTIMENAAVKYKRTINAVQCNGKTIAQCKGERGALTRSTTIMENGKSITQNNVEACAKNKKETILENGMSKMQNTVLKSAITKFGRVVYVYVEDELITIADRRGIMRELFKTKTNAVIELFDNGGGFVEYQKTTYEITGVPKKSEHQYISTVV